MHNVKFTIFNILSVMQFSDMKYIHSVVEPSALFPELSTQIETLSLTSPFSFPPAPESHDSALFLCEFAYSRYLI